MAKKEPRAKKAKTLSSRDFAPGQKSVTTPEDQYRAGLSIGIANARSGRPALYTETSSGGLVNNNGMLIQAHAADFGRGALDGHLIEVALTKSPGIPHHAKAQLLAKQLGVRETTN